MSDEAFAVKRRRAAQGAAQLDTHVPGWANQVDLARLSIPRKDADTVLGQLFGDWHVGLAELGLTEDQAEEFGFELHMTTEAHPKIDDELQQAWLAEIGRRVFGDDWTWKRARRPEA